MSGAIDAQTAVKTIVARPITTGTFAPFGVVFQPAEHNRLPNRTYGSDIVSHRPAPIDSDRPLEWLLSVLRLREFRVLFLERHLELSQAFIPLGGHPLVLVVAAPGCELENEVPILDDVHAFIVGGDVAVQLHRGAWHEPPFALIDNSSVLITSHGNLTSGLAEPLDEHHEIHQLDVDKRNVTERTGVISRVTLP